MTHPLWLTAPLMALLLTASAMETASASALDLWSQRQSGILVNLTGIASSGEGFMIAGITGLNLLSSDGVTWTCSDTGPDPLNYPRWQRVVFGNGGWYFAGDSLNREVHFGECVTESDWVVVGVSGRIQSMSLADGQWTDHSSSTTSTLHGITYVGGKYVAVGDRGTIVSSVGLDSWRLQSTSITNNLEAITYADGVFVAVGAAGAIIVSNDAQDWKSPGTAICASGVNFLDVTYGNRYFVAVGEIAKRGIIASSRGADAWIKRPVQSPQLNAVAYQDGAFVAVGEEGTILQSADSRIPSLLVYLLPNGDLELLVADALTGQTVAIESSPDLLNWTEIYQETKGEGDISLVATRDPTAAAQFYRLRLP